MDGVCHKMGPGDEKEQIVKEHHEIDTDTACKQNTEAGGQNLLEKFDLNLLKTVKDDVEEEDNTEIRNSRIRKKVIPLLDYNEDGVFEKAMKDSNKRLKDDNPKQSSPSLLDDPSIMKKLVMKCLVRVKNMKLSEKQLAQGFITSDQNNIEMNVQSLITSSNSPGKPRRIRKNVMPLYDYDEDVAYRKAMEESLKQSTCKATSSLDDSSSMKKLAMHCFVRVRKIKLSEEQFAQNTTAADKMDIDVLDDKEVKLQLLLTNSNKCETEGEEEEKTPKRSYLPQSILPTTLSSMRNMLPPSKPVSTNHLNNGHPNFSLSDSVLPKDSNPNTGNPPSLSMNSLGKMPTLRRKPMNAETQKEATQPESLIPTQELPQPLENKPISDWKQKYIEAAEKRRKILTAKICCYSADREVTTAEKLESDELDHKDVKLEPLLTNSSKPDNEDVQKKLDRPDLGGCLNICSTFKDRNRDQTTMPEHFLHISGFACIVCRKPEKSKEDLMKHLDTSHSRDILEMLGVGSLEVYEEQFSTNSDEQINLRAEVYSKIGCNYCEQIFFSCERMTMHIELGQCHTADYAEEEDIHLKSHLEKNGTPFEYLNGFKEGEVNPLDSLETQYSDSDDETLIPKIHRVHTKSLLHEQLSIYADYPGLKECLSGSAPYCCVVPSCNLKPYPSISSYRRHLTTHDPEMYAYLICPICQYVRSDDHPGDMRKHVLYKHGRDEDWARENVIVDISDKLQEFRRATTKDVRQKRNNVKLVTKKLSKSPQVSISLEDPAIRSSFIGESGPDIHLVCGVSDCSKTFKSAHHLKQHYVKHDATLRSNIYECNSCLERVHRLDRIKCHIEKVHPEVLILLEAGEEQWRLVKWERWEEFSEQVNVLIGENTCLKGETLEPKDGEMVTLKPVSKRPLKVSISLDDPSIRTSFTGERGTDTYLVCGVRQCAEEFKCAHNLKQHYLKHDDTLRKNVYECNLCPETLHSLNRMKYHIEKLHPEVNSLLESGEEQWKLVKCQRWEEFSEHIDALIQENQYLKEDTLEAEDYEMIHAVCSHCSLTFNTQPSFLDHEKMHQPSLVSYTCQLCQEGFIVESVFINHVKGHTNPYKCMKFGSIRCNGCSQYFEKKPDVKNHLRKYHMNLLNNCIFCDQCSTFFLHKKYLKKHMFSHKKKQKKPVFKCPVCKNLFLSQEEADLHISKKRCKVNKTYRCPHGCKGKFTKVGYAKHKRSCKEEEDNSIWG